MESICRFVPAKNIDLDIKTVHFVYETDIKNLKQPFESALFRVALVTEGSGVLKIGKNKYDLTPKTLFFTFPGECYEIDFDDDFKYIYITFVGSYVSDMLESFGIGHSRFVFKDFTHTDLWYDAIWRITSLNANILTESVLCYTLSVIGTDSQPCVSAYDKKQLMDMLSEYIDLHYREADISLGKIAKKFSYTEKYLSSFFKTNMKINFSEYINTLRIRYGMELLNDGNYTVSQIASMCGYSDSLYFSKVFKKQTGHTPSEYIKEHRIN